MSTTAETLPLRAQALGRDYQVTLQPPAGGAEPRAALFVLDGNIYHPLMTQVTLLRSLGGEIEPVLVVGIGYPEEDPEVWMSRRTADLTPCAPLNPRPWDSPDPAAWGDADRFLDFIDEQVQPLVRARFPVAAQHRVLFGHSLGGLAVVRALLRRPAAYEGWFAVSPSVWWEDRMVLKDLGPWSASAHRPARPPKAGWAFPSTWAARACGRPPIRRRWPRPRAPSCAPASWWTSSMWAGAFPRSIPA